MNRPLVLAEWHHAHRSLHAAEVLLNERYYEDAVSRAYYAILHAAKAALHVHDVAAESHAAVNRLFGLHLIRNGDLEREWASHLVESLDDRLAADYDAEAAFSAEDASYECRRAGEFVARIHRYLLAKGLTEQELESRGHA